MWDAATGAKQYTFEGHEAAVFSVCPHHKENIQVMILFLDSLNFNVISYLVLLMSCF